MNLKLESQDLEAIAGRVAEMLAPMLSNKGPVTPNDDILDVKGLAQYLKVRPGWIYEKTHMNEIPYCKKGNRLFFRKQDIDTWLMEGYVPASGGHYLRKVVP